MATRPTRPTATKLYPNPPKTKSRQTIKEGETIEKQRKNVNQSQVNDNNEYKQSGGIKRDATYSTTANSGTNTAQKVSKSAGKESKTQTGSDIQSSSNTSKGAAKDGEKVKAELTLEKPKLSAKSKASSSLIRSETIKVPVGDRETNKGTYKNANTIADMEVTRKSNVAAKKGSANKPSVQSINGIDKPYASQRNGTHSTGADVSQNGNPDRASKASRLLSETGKQLFTKERVVVPKATKLHDKTKPKKVVTTPLIMLMNVKGHDDKNGSILERRRHIIHNVIHKYLPALVLIQDFKLPEISSTFWSTHSLPAQYTYIGNEDVSMMYDTTRIDVQDIPVTEFENTLQGLYRHSNNKLKRTAPADFDPFPRMCARVVKSKQGPPLNFICISWHGDFVTNGGGKLKHAQRLEYFEYLMEFLRIVKEKVKMPILIAGNFNVDMYSVEPLVHKPFQLCIYDASMRRTVPGIVDYYVITEDLELNEISWVSLREETTAYQPNGVMNHDPVRALITGKPTKGGVFKGMVNPQKWQPSRGKGTVK